MYLTVEYKPSTRQGNEMAKQPKIELKSIKVHVGLSEETVAYTAKIYADGKHFADVSNCGHGGPDDLGPPKSPYDRPEFWEAVRVLEKRIADTFPKHVFEDGGEMDESLECLCQKMAWEHVEQRNWKSRMSRKVIAFKEDKLFSYKGKKSDQLMDAILKREPEAIILNRLPFSEAWALIQKAA